MSRSSWAWTKSRFGHVARTVSSLIAMERVATVVMLMLALCPAVALGKVGKGHHRESAGSTTQASRTDGATHSKSHNPGPPRAARPAGHAGNSARGLLALGSGYSAPRGSKAVKLLQRRLVTAGFPPGPIDGRYGLLTEHAVIGFQATHGLRVDGIAGPVTRAALAAAKPVLAPGSGYIRAGSAPVRRLQRELAAAGYSPGPADGRYGPRTERAVRRLQHARHLSADGIAGPHTLHQLQELLAQRGQPRSHRVGGRSGAQRRGSRATAGRASGAPTPTRTATSQPNGVHRPGGSPILWIVLLACLLAAVVARVLGRRRRRRGDRSRSETPLPDGDPVGAEGARDERGRPAAAFELGVMLVLTRYRSVARRAFRRPDHRHPDTEFDLGTLLPQEENRGAAEHAFRLADDRGHAGAACNLGVLLEERGDPAGARDAYRRADERGHAVGAYNLGAMLEQEGDLRGAMDAYRRADERGDSKGAYSLGVLLEREGNLAGAEAAYRRAEQRGDPDAAGNLAHLLRPEGDGGAPLDVDAVASTQKTQRSPEDQGETAVVSEPDRAADRRQDRATRTW